MNRNVLPVACVALLTLAACSSSKSGSAVADTSAVSDASSTTVVAETSTTVGADASSTTTSPPSSAPSSTAATTTAPPATTPPPTTAPCRAVGEFPGNYYELNFSLRRGDCGPAVETLQSYLNNIYGYSLVVDGRFGPATERAVREMQERFFGPGPAVTGVLDRDTWTAMVGSDPPPDA